MTVSQVEEQPNVTWDAEKSDFYTLCMIGKQTIITDISNHLKIYFVDPDAPDRDEPKFRSWLHWLVTNIPGNDISKGDVLTEYVGCKPPTSLNLHRYTFLLYKQNGQISFAENRSDRRYFFFFFGKLINVSHMLVFRSEEHRPNFSVKQFVKKYQLGPLVAANFFSGAYDHQVHVCA